MSQWGPYRHTAIAEYLQHAAMVKYTRCPAMPVQLNHLLQAPDRLLSATAMPCTPAHPSNILHDLIHQHAHAKALTWPHLHITRLQPPFFSTILAHLGQGLVLAMSQLRVSLSPLDFSSHACHMLHVQGEWGSFPHLKQKVTPHEHSGST